MSGAVYSADSAPGVPGSPVNCRWATLAKHESSTGENNLVDLPYSEQVARGKELLSMLQEAPFPLGDSCAAMPAMPSGPPSRSETPQSLPPPGLEMPPREVAPAGFHVDHAGRQLQQPAAAGHQQQREWLMSPSGTPPPPLQPQPHFPPVRNPPTAPQLHTTAPWAMSDCVGASASGNTWATLSTNPGSMHGGWLSTGVSECDATGVAASSAGMSHITQGFSSASSVPLSYTMPSPSSADNGLWSAHAGQPPAPSNAGPVSAMPASFIPAAGKMLSFLSPPMMQVEKQSGNQLRAEAAPYVPGHTGVQAC